MGLGISMAITSSPNALPDTSPAATGIPNLTTSQRKRIKSYLKRCRLNPRHTQLNLEGYLLLPVQRVPRYKLLVCLFPLFFFFFFFLRFLHHFFKAGGTSKEYSPNVRIHGRPS